MELTGVETHDAAWLAAFAPAADRYFAASKAYQRATEAALKDADTLLAARRPRCNGATPSMSRSSASISTGNRQHDTTAKYYADSAKRRADLVGKPAADWELQGLDGKPHALAGYRGKVVVLDFWYRGCGWCIKAMPQLNTLAEQFQGRPVAVLGMNTDRKEADAKFVADAMGLEYAMLRAEGIPKKYGVQVVPDTDRHRTARARSATVHEGYSPTPGRAGEGDQASCRRSDGDRRRDGSRFRGVPADPPFDYRSRLVDTINDGIAVWSSTRNSEVTRSPDPGSSSVLSFDNPRS